MNLLANMIVSLLLSTGLSMAGLKAPEVIVKFSSPQKSLLIQMEPPSGHHFNVDAPTSLQLGSKRLKPSLAQARKLEFTLAETREDLLLTVYVCDEKNTFCEKHSIKGAWNSRTSAYQATYKTAEGPLSQIENNSKST
ncbi:MAG: hypothetical protein AABZ55_12070, partial [Bdellovibrionota bacterium]